MGRNQRLAAAPDEHLELDDTLELSGALASSHDSKRALSPGRAREHAPGRPRLAAVTHELDVVDATPGSHHRSAQRIEVVEARLFESHFEGL